MCTHFPLHYFFPFRALWRTKKIVLYFFKNNFRCIFFYKRTFWNYLRSLTLVVIITLDCNLLLWRDFLPNDLEGSRGKLVLWLSLKDAADFQRLRILKKIMYVHFLIQKLKGKYEIIIYLYEKIQPLSLRSSFENPDFLATSKIKALDLGLKCLMVSPSLHKNDLYFPANFSLSSSYRTSIRIWTMWPPDK